LLGGGPREAPADMASARVVPLDGSEASAAVVSAVQAAQLQLPLPLPLSQQGPRQQRSSVGRAVAGLLRQMSAGTVGERTALSQWFDMSPGNSIARPGPLAMVLLQLMLCARALMLSVAGLALAGLTLWAMSCIQGAWVGSSAIESLAASVGNGTAFELSYEVGYCGHTEKGWASTFRGVDLYVATAAGWGFSQATYIYMKSRFEPAIIPVLPVYVAVSGGAVFVLGALVGRFALGGEYAAAAIVTQISAFLVYLPHRVYAIRNGAPREASTMTGEFLNIIFVCFTSAIGWFLSALYPLLVTGLSGLPLVLVSVTCT
jgi:hypothetical protein